MLADCYLQTGQANEVVSLLQPREQMFGADLAFAYVLGTALLDLQRTDEGQAYVDRIFGAGESAEARLLMGTAYMNRKQFREARTELQQAIKLNPRLPTAHSLYGRAMLALGDHQAAEAAFRKELELNVNDFQANIQLGSLRSRTQRFAEATAYVERAVTIRPEDFAARRLLANLRLQTGRAEEAATLFEALVKETPDAVDLHVQLATAYNRLKRTADAQREREIVDKLNAAEAAKQKGGRDDAAVNSRAPNSRLPGELLDRGVIVLSSQSAPFRADAERLRSKLEAGSRRQPAGRASRQAGRAAAASSEFEKLLKAATEARQAERWDEAVQLYGRLVKLKPDYVEGYWYQGTAYYSLDNYPQCRDVFRKVVTLAPKNGAGYAFLGLCEFGLKEYDRSLPHLLRSRDLGVGDVPDLASVARYHAALLMARMDQHEQALETLGEFAAEGNDNPRVIEALGIATLRMPFLPSEVPPDRREMILMAGRASYQMATRNTAAAEKAFEQLALRYPETPNVHYAFGVFLLQEKGERAIEEFKRELELQPAHPSSLMQIAFEYLKQGDAKTALTFAQQAVAAAPKEFPARKALGQALLDTGDVDGAIRELLAGIKMAPDSPGLHFLLGRAYQRAGRLEDANRERAEFTRLDRLARTRKSGEQSVGGHIER